MSETSGRLVILATTPGGSVLWHDASAGWTSIGTTDSVQALSAGTDSNGYADAFVLQPNGALQWYSVTSGWITIPPSSGGGVASVVAADQGLAIAVDASAAVLEYAASVGWAPLTSSGFMDI